MRCLLLFPILPAAFLRAQAPPPNPPAYQPAPAEKQQIADRAAELGARLAQLRGKAASQLLADVEVYHKAASWLLRHPEEFYNKAYAGHALLVLDRGLARASALQAGSAPWTTRKGRVNLAYRSRVDGSVQPYAVVVPESYDGSRPVRLDVVLHGRGAMLSEISFLERGESAGTAPAYPDRIELHVFGRTNNAYRWSGETDVFEALADVKSRFRIDPARIVLRGFSMGGAGAWHIGLHHPDLWAAIEAGAGFTETRRYANVSNPPAWVAPTLHIYDAVDYARNAFNVPTVGYGGETDPQLRASLNIQEQLGRESGLEGIRALFLVGPNTGHRFHPDSKKESDAFLDRHAAAGLAEPGKIRFVTYTTRYNRCFRIVVDGLERHYERAQVDANARAITTSNVSRLTVLGEGTVELDGQTFPRGGSFEKKSGKWTTAGPLRGLRKKHGLQGPIDDAFSEPFLCVRPSSGPAPRLDRFAAEFAKWLRGDVRIVDDRSVTPAHIRDYHLVLFGDAATNRMIARVAPKLPIRWEKDTIRAGPRSFPASGHTLVLIYPNPLNPSKYVVLNTGHTFGEKEFRGTNALLYPRLGDWAILNSKGEPVAAGLFDDNWRLAPGD